MPKPPGLGSASQTPPTLCMCVGDTSDHALRVQVGSATKMPVPENGGTSIGTNNVNTTPGNGLYVHGNTGLGLVSPDDRLDVNVNVDLTGVFEANGNAGRAGQVFVSNGSGGMDWEDKGPVLRILMVF